MRHLLPRLDLSTPMIFASKFAGQRLQRVPRAGCVAPSPCPAFLDFHSTRLICRGESQLTASLVLQQFWCKRAAHSCPLSCPDTTLTLEYRLQTSLAGLVVRRQRWQRGSPVIVREINSKCRLTVRFGQLSAWSIPVPAPLTCLGLQRCKCRYACQADEGFTGKITLPELLAPNSRFLVSDILFDEGHSLLTGQEMNSKSVTKLAFPRGY